MNKIWSLYKFHILALKLGPENKWVFEIGSFSIELVECNVVVVTRDFPIINSADTTPSMTPSLWDEHKDTFL